MNDSNIWGLKTKEYEEFKAIKWDSTSRYTTEEVLEEYGADVKLYGAYASGLWMYSVSDPGEGEKEWTVPTSSLVKIISSNKDCPWLLFKRRRDSEELRRWPKYVVTQVRNKKMHLCNTINPCCTVGLKEVLGSKVMRIPEKGVPLSMEEFKATPGRSYISVIRRNERGNFQGNMIMKSSLTSHFAGQSVESLIKEGRVFFTQDSAEAFINNLIAQHFEKRKRGEI